MIKKMIGKVFSKVQIDNDTIKFYEENGNYFLMYHEQKCCEQVQINDIVGDIRDLVGSEILIARESSNSSNNDDGSETWTFYNFAT